MDLQHILYMFLYLRVIIENPCKQNGHLQHLLLRNCVTNTTAAHATKGSVIYLDSISKVEIHFPTCGFKCSPCWMNKLDNKCDFKLSTENRIRYIRNLYHDKNNRKTERKFAWKCFLRTLMCVQLLIKIYIRLIHRTSWFASRIHLALYFVDVWWRMWL